jgi:hypothetical protein
MRALTIAIMTILAAAVVSAKPRRVHEVHDVTATLIGNRITVKANGSVVTAGWKDAKLVRVSKADGTLTYDFVATPPPPDAMVAQVITPISVTSTTTPLPSFPTKVKVVAQTNSKTVTVTETK